MRSGGRIAIRFSPSGMGIAVVLGALLSVGCGSTHGHRSWGMAVSVPSGAEGLRVAHSLPEAYGILALSVESSDGMATPGEGKEFVEAYPFPLEVVEEHLAEALEGSGGFTRIVRVPREEGKSSVDVARKAGAGLLLEVKLQRPYLAFVERTNGAYLGLFVWIWAGWATHWWHDQAFEVNFNSTASLTDLLNDRRVGEKALPEISREEVLSFHERSRGMGMYLLTLIWPPTFSSPDPETAAENLLASAGPGIYQPLADLLSRMTLTDIVRLERPEPKGLPLKLTFESPLDGSPAKEKTNLRFCLGLPGTLKDLVMVRLNGEILWDVGALENVPRVESITIEKDAISFDQGKATLEVSLRSSPEPVRAVIHLRPEVRLQDEPLAD